MAYPSCSHTSRNENAMAVYDSRNRTRNEFGHVVVPISGTDDDIERINAAERRRSSNPLNWKRTECDISVSGLGAYRTYRSHPGRIFPSTALTVRDTGATADEVVVPKVATEL